MSEIEISEQLAELYSEELMSDSVYEITDNWIAKNVGFAAVKPVLKFMEAHKDWDFGVPGRFVSYLEKFGTDGYEAALVESIKRFPTPHTIWMLNRVINGEKESSKKGEYLRVLALAKNNRVADSETIDAINFFLGTHYNL